MKKSEYYEPKSVEEALSLFRGLSGSRKWLAGGTELLVKLKRRCTNVDHLISLKRIPGLTGIFADEQGIRVGAMTTLNELANRASNAGFKILAEAAQGVASPNIRRQATLGGNLCQGPKCYYYLNRGFWSLPACYLAGGTLCNAIKGAKRCTAMSPVDTAPALLALGAEIDVVNSEGIKRMTLEEFFTNPGANILREDEIVTSIYIPQARINTCQNYVKFSHRGTIDYAIASVGVTLGFEQDGKSCKDARIVLGGVDVIPVRAADAERLLEGREIDGVSMKKAAESASKACHPSTDVEASANYRRYLVRVLVRKALTNALKTSDERSDSLL